MFFLRAETRVLSSKQIETVAGSPAALASAAFLSTKKSFRHSDPERRYAVHGATGQKDRASRGR